jgi:glycosyltransferase involved in cell wall biosynthesis
MTIDLDIDNNLINQKIIFKLLFSILIIIIYLKFNNIDFKVSVIIPTYNRGNLIINSIKSVLNQTFRNLEVIVVDDGSTDNTEDEVNKITDKRIKYIKLSSNRGGSNARNVGIKNATGQFISFQDSDDIFYPNKIEKQIKNIINKNSIFDFCKINVIYNSTYSYLIPNARQENSIIKGEIFNELISRGNFISTQSMIIRTKYMKNHLFDIEMPRLQDYDVILGMIPKVKISYTNEVLVDLHIQNNSVTHSPSKLKKAIYILLNKKYDFNKSQKESFLKYLKYLLKFYFNKTN